MICAYGSTVIITVATFIPLNVVGQIKQDSNKADSDSSRLFHNYGAATPWAHSRLLVTLLKSDHQPLFPNNQPLSNHQQPAPIPITGPQFQKLTHSSDHQSSLSIPRTQYQSPASSSSFTGLMNTKTYAI